MQQSVLLGLEGLLTVLMLCQEMLKDGQMVSVIGRFLDVGGDEVEEVEEVRLQMRDYPEEEVEGLCWIQLLLL